MKSTKLLLKKIELKNLQQLNIQVKKIYSKYRIH